ncbi:MAG: ComF family protein [Proteobacteria bacterium]|nr:ComF family protein [Pseudomonadota bacterium]
MLLPARCIACGVQVDTPGSVCAHCWKELHFITSNACITCGHPFEAPVPEGTRCGHCISEPPEYTHARAVLRYDDHSRPLVTRFKYGDALHGTRSFARWMAAAGSDILRDADMLIPVPLHRLRLLHRRYNQSAILAHAIGKHTGVAVRPQGLVRHKRTPAQAGLSKSARNENVKHAFRVPASERARLSGKHVVLIDDVMTTGATIRECTRVLLKNGVASVRILTLARTVIES